MAEELETHRDLLTRDLASVHGPGPGARDAARRIMGNELQAREDARAVWIAPWFDQARQDVRFAGRQLRHAPAFALTAILLSALGVGATTAVFSVVHALLLSPLPYPDADRIYALGTAAGGGVDGQAFHAVMARSRALSALAAQRQSGGWNLVAGSHAESVQGLRVSAAYFRALGVSPRLGRGFTADEDAPGGLDVAVVSAALWRRAFAERPDVLGQTILLGGTPHAVVGVLPDGFQSTPDVDVWTPLRLSARDTSVNYLVLGRLAPGAPPTQVNAELELAKADLIAAQPEDAHPRTRSLVWVPLQRRLGLEIALPLVVLLLAVAATSAVACANLTGLLLFRTLAREREVATRLALGASRGRVMRQLLTESLTLATLGGILGVLAAAWGTSTLTHLVPSTLLVGRTVHVESTVLTVAAFITVVIGVVFGLAPALAVRRFDLRVGMGHVAGESGPRQTWGRRWFVAGEVAATTALLVLGAMLGQSLVRMYSADLGFDPDGVTVGRTALSGEVFADGARLRALAERAVSALRAVPGVEAAALANNAPVERGMNLAVAPSTGTRVTTIRSVDWRYVTPEYFAVLRMAMRFGRVFDERDRDESAPVAIVNAAFARAYFGREQVVGESLVMDASIEDERRDIVGVVQDAVSKPGAGWTRGFSARGAGAAPIVYVPLAQAPARGLAATHQYFPATWLVRAHPGAGDVSRALEDAVRGVEPSLAFVNIQPLGRVVDEDIQAAQTLAALVGVLSAVSLLIASVGLFGLVAYAAAVRRRETAIRLALGASRSSLVRTLMSEIAAIAAVGSVVGLVLAVGLSRVAQASLGHLAGADALTVAGTLVVLGLTVGMAVAWPAIRASRADPLSTLRTQ